MVIITLGFFILWIQSLNKVNSNVTPTSPADALVCVPHEYYCPITRDIMLHPVVAEDGFSYEKDAVVSWLSNHNTSPKTGKVISDHLINNENLRILIQGFLSEHPQLKVQVYQPTSAQRSMATEVDTDEADTEELNGGNQIPFPEAERGNVDITNLW